MLDPTMVATSVSHFPLCDKAASKVGVASMTPASQGGRMNPTIGCSRRRRSSPDRVTLAHTVGNLLVVAANVGWRQLKYARDIRVTLQQMSSTEPPVNVHFGPFKSLRQRLVEANVDFRVIDSPAEIGLAGQVRYPIPTPGNLAFWLEGQPRLGYRMRSHR